MKKLLTLLLALAMIFSLVACNTTTDNPAGTENKGNVAGNTGDDSAVGGDDTPEDSRYGGTFTMAVNIGDTLDPMKTSGWKSYYWSMNVFENVLYRDAEGNLAPGVCDFELSDDNLTLTLWVREGVTFHNGDPVDIEDVLASIQRASKTISRMKNHYVPYLESETIEGDKLIIKFTEYDINTLWYFAANQTWNVVMPKEICEKYGADDAIITVEDCIGTGPYKVESAELGQEIVLVRYEGYVANEEGRTGIAAPKNAYFDKIVVTVTGESQVDYMKLVSGEIDFVGMDEELEELYVSSGLTISTSPDTSFYYFYFNCDGDGAVSNANVRKAIAAAIDYETFATILGDLAVTDADHLTCVTGSYSSPYSSTADYMGAANPTLAKQYLDAAGYNGEEIIFLLSSANADYAPLIKSDLEAAGLNVTFQYMDYTAMQEYVSSSANDWDVAWASSSVTDMPSTVASKYISDTWTHETKDELVSQLSLYPVGSETSISLWNQIDQIIADECPTFIVAQRTAGTFVQNPDLVWEIPDGIWLYWWNAYWTNPSEH